MSNLLMFFFGFTIAMLFAYSDIPVNTVSWYSGFIIGAFVTSALMFFFAKNVAKQSIKELNIHETEVIKDQDILDYNKDMYFNDPDWWKNEEKRKKHLKDTYGDTEE